MNHLPLPELESTRSLLKDSIHPLVSHEEYQTSLKKINDFFNSELSKTLQKRLEERRDAFPNSSWLYDWWRDETYLKNRNPLPYSSSYFFHIDTKQLPGDPSLMTAAKLIYRMVEYRQAMAPIVPTAESKGMPTSTNTMFSSEFLFNTSRIPGKDMDCMKTYDKFNNHICIAIRNHFFAFDVVDNSGTLYSVDAIVSSLTEIVRRINSNINNKENKKREDEYNLGYWTSRPRNEWYDEYINIQDKTSLEKIQSCMFLVCLDETNPSNPDELLDQVYNSTNRCWDKSIQLVYFQNGECGIIGEHTLLDGDVVMRFLDEIIPKVIQIKNEKENDIDYDDSVILSNNYKQHVEQLVVITHPIQDNNHTNKTYKSLFFNHYGKKEIYNLELAPDSYVQMCIQLAYYTTYGKCDATYESVKTNSFLHGRTDVERTVTDASVKLCTASTHIDETVFYPLFVDACHKHIEQVEYVSSGKGCDRHLFGLQLCLADNEHVELFHDEGFLKSQHWLIGTTNLESDRVDFWNTNEIEPDGIGITYMIHDNSIHFTFTTTLNPILPIFVDNLNKWLLQTYHISKRQQTLLSGNIEINNTMTDNDVLNRVVHVVSNFIDNISPIHYNTPLFDLGFTSVMFMKLRYDLELEFQQNIHISVLFGKNTIRKLSEFFQQQHQEEEITDEDNQNSQLESAEDNRNDLAIIGLGCKFPGRDTDCEDIDTFWQLLSSPNKQEPSLVKIMDRHLFDPEYFGMTTQECEHMSERQKWVVQVAYQTLVDAGLIQAPSLHLHHKSNNRVGVFVGTWSADTLVNTNSIFDVTARSNTILANRISYLFDLEGPSMIIDTACSSSIVAIDIACNALMNNECDYALVIGVNVVDAQQTELLQNAGFLSPTGRCHTFDVRADGYVRSEGCAGIVISKRKHSEKNTSTSTNINYASIRSVAINQDGRSVNLHAPNPEAQFNILKTSLHRAGLSPSDISFIETHGTGTKLGDPIEISALHRVYGDHLCYLSAVKTHFGHMESCAGMIGLLKAILCLQHQIIPMNPFLEDINPEIDFGMLHPVQSPVTLTTNGPDKPLHAGISSFGYGGTNSHIIIQQGSKKYKSACIPWSRRVFDVLNDTITGKQNKVVPHVHARGKTPVCTQEKRKKVSWSRRVFDVLNDTITGKQNKVVPYVRVRGKTPVCTQEETINVSRSRRVFDVLNDTITGKQNKVVPHGVARGKTPVCTQEETINVSRSRRVFDVLTDSITGKQNKVVPHGVAREKTPVCTLMKRIQVSWSRRVFDVLTDSITGKQNKVIPHGVAREKTPVCTQEETINVSWSRRVFDVLTDTITGKQNKVVPHAHARGKTHVCTQEETINVSWSRRVFDVLTDSITGKQNKVVPHGVAREKTPVCTQEKRKKVSWSRRVFDVLTDSITGKQNKVVPHGVARGKTPVCTQEETINVSRSRRVFDVLTDSITGKQNKVVPYVRVREKTPVCTQEKRKKVSWSRRVFDVLTDSITGKQNKVVPYVRVLVKTPVCTLMKRKKVSWSRRVFDVLNDTITGKNIQDNTDINKEKFFSFNNILLQVINNDKSDEILIKNTTTPIMEILDSLTLVELRNNIINNLNISIEIEDMSKMTINQLKTYVEANHEKIVAITSSSDIHDNDMKSSSQDIILNMIPLHPLLPSTVHQKQSMYPIIFILSTPRSGSSLLSFILNTNHGLFVPQELYLLPFKNLQERALFVKEYYLEQGFRSCLKQLKKWTDDDVDIFIKNNQTTPMVDIYKFLQAACFPKILVDKTPMYGTYIEILQQTKLMFSTCKFINLKRHPAACIPSWLNLIHKSLHLRNKVHEQHRVSIQDVESQWIVQNQNIDTFLETEDHVMTISFEEYLMEPDRVIPELCCFCSVSYDESMLNPYSQNTLYQDKDHFVQTIDPGLFKHDALDKKNADKWRSVQFSTIKTNYLGIRYGYQLPMDSNHVMTRLNSVFDILHSRRRGPPVIFFHDIFGNSSIYNDIASEIGRPCFGINFTDQCLECDTLEALCRYYSCIIDAMGWKEVDFVGYSYGCRTSVFVNMLLNKTKVRRHLLVDGAVTGPVPSSIFKYKTNTMKHLIRLASDYSLDMIGFTGLESEFTCLKRDVLQYDEIVIQKLCRMVVLDKNINHFKVLKICKEDIIKLLNI